MGDVEITDEVKYSGSNAVKVTSAGGGYNRGYLTLDLAEAPASLQSEMYGRMMIYVSDANANAGDFTFLQAEGTTPKAPSGAPAGTTTKYRGRIDGRYDHVFTNYDTQVDTDGDTQEDDWPTDCWNQPEFTETTPPASTYILPKNEWVCVRWHMNKVSNHLAVHLNNATLSEISVHDVGDGCVDETTQGGIWYAPEQFEKIHFGVEQYHEHALPRTVYIDDIAIDDTRVDCPSTPAQ